MHAVIRTGGKQYRVAEGDILRVEKLQAEAGDTVELDEVLLISSGDTVAVGTPLVAGGKVTAEVQVQGRADKIDVIKFKRRKKYRRKQGHRQSYTQIKVTGIAGAGVSDGKKAKADEKAAPKADVKDAHDTAKAPAAKQASASQDAGKAAVTAKSDSKTADTVKKPAAKKSAAKPAAKGEDAAEKPAAKQSAAKPAAKAKDAAEKPAAKKPAAKKATTEARGAKQVSSDKDKGDAKSGADNSTAKQSDDSKKSE